MGYKKRDEERVYAEKLRESGKSYTEIQEACIEKFSYKPNKGVLSNWLGSIQLNSKQIADLATRTKSRNYLGGVKGAQINKQKKQDRIAKIEENIDYEFDMQELKTAGLMLYWGEGTKYSDHRVSVSNSDPYVHRLFITWLEKCYGIKRENLSFCLQIHGGLNAEEALNYWCKELGIKQEQFIKVYVKKKNNSNHRKNKLYMGTLQSGLCKTELRYQIIFEIEEIKKHFSG